MEIICTRGVWGLVWSVCGGDFVSQHTYMGYVKCKEYMS